MNKVFFWGIYEYLLSLIEVILFYGFLDYTLKRNRQVKNIYYYSSIVLLSIFIFALTQVNIYSILRIFIMYIIFLFIAYKLFQGNIKGKFLFVTIFYFFLIFTDILSVNIISYFVGRDIGNIIINQTWARLLFSQISKILLFIILKIIKDYYKASESEIPPYYWYWILFICFISIVNLLVIFYISMILNDYNVGMQNLMVSISLGSLLIVAMTYYIFINFKNHVICIENLIKEGKSESAIKYINNLQNKAFKTYTWINTGNDVVDAVLNQKKSEASSKNINMDVKVSIPKDIGIEPLDLCTILGNALDNSIEANEKIQDEAQRYIKVIMNPYKDYLFIEISNPSIINPIDEDGKLRTTKKDKENHGFGIKSIESVVEKYNGMLSYEYVNGKFILNIMVPL